MKANPGQINFILSLLRRTNLHSNCLSEDDLREKYREKSGNDLNDIDKDTATQEIKRLKKLFHTQRGYWP